LDPATARSAEPVWRPRGPTLPKQADDAPGGRRSGNRRLQRDIEAIARLV